MATRTVQAPSCFLHPAMGKNEKKKRFINDPDAIPATRSSPGQQEENYTRKRDLTTTQNCKTNPTSASCPVPQRAPTRYSDGAASMPEQPLVQQMPLFGMMFSMPHLASACLPRQPTRLRSQPLRRRSLHRQGSRWKPWLRKATSCAAQVLHHTLTAARSVAAASAGSGVRRLRLAHPKTRNG